MAKDKTPKFREEDENSRKRRDHMPKEPYIRTEKYKEDYMEEYLYGSDEDIDDDDSKDENESGEGLDEPEKERKE